MLIELKVRNFAIIDQLSLSFGPGLNIVSGETGAGKSILLKSLGLLMGEKSEADTVRNGVDQAIIEGLFDLSQRPDIVESLESMGIDCADESLIVRRVISSEGKGKVYLNGSLSPLASLKGVVAPLITLTGHHTPLIEMTGQHDNRHLQSKAYHLEVLDMYSGSWTLRVEFEKQYHRRLELKIRLEELRLDAQSREQRLDFLHFQKDEIEALHLRPEDDDLPQRVARLKNSQKIIDFASQAVGTLYSNDDSVTVQIHQVLQRASELAQHDPELSVRLKSLSESKALVEDAVYEIREYGRAMSLDGDELSQMEERLSLFRRLQRKYGDSVETIQNAQKEIVNEIELLESSDHNVKALRDELDKLEKSMSKLAVDLHERRRNGAHLLEKGVNEELLDLNMKGVIFSVSVDWLPEYQATGQSGVEFMIQASKKDAPRPMAKVASGGELSRILLALKRVVGSSDRPRTYLFDEVDTGVSGQTAEKVGKKLKAISKGQQLICVTHLPQVASFADGHYFIEKTSTKSGKAQMSVRLLDANDRVNEIARLISGEKISKASLQHAKDLIDQST